MDVNNLQLPLEIEELKDLLIYKGCSPYTVFYLNFKNSLRIIIDKINKAPLNKYWIEY